MDLTFPDIYGADRGFNVAADVLTQTADGVPLNELWTEFQEALRQWNAGRSAFQALFTFNTTDAFKLDPVITGPGLRFEKASEFGQPVGGRAKPDYLRMGYSFDWYDMGLRYTRQYLRTASAEQVRGQQMAVQTADNELVFSAIMSALTTKAVDAPSRPVSPEGLPIYGLWDGLGDVPPAFGGRTFSGSHSHYLVSGGSTIDGVDLKQLIDTIKEHGHGLRSSNEQIMIYVHPNEFDTISKFRRNESVLPSTIASPYDFVPAQGTPAYLSPDDVIGDKAPATFNGLAIEGSFGDAYITQNYLVPAGYVIAVASSGAGSTRNPVAFRQFPRAESQGLILAGTNSQYPLIESFYERGFGVGVANRSAAAVMQIKSSGSYDNPTWPGLVA